MQVAQQNIGLMGKALFPSRQRFEASVSENYQVVQSQGSVTGANPDYIDSMSTRSRRGFLRTWGKRTRIIGKPTIRLVAVGAVLTSTLCAQQAAPPTVCSNVLSGEACELALLRRDASRSVQLLHYRGLQYGSFTDFRYQGAYRTQNELPSSLLWASPFSSRREDGLSCCGSDLSAGRSGDASASTDSDGPLGLAGVNLGAQSQQNPPAPQATRSAAVQGSPKHIFFVVPAFQVSYLKQFKPLTSREKFGEWIRGTYDPGGLGLYAAEAATLEHSSHDGFCGYGKGWGNYGKCLGSMELDANISSFLGDFLFPVILHQDPRYFRRGEGSVGARTWYAITRVFVTHADSGRTVFFTSALVGSVIAAAASNLYYPRRDRGFGPSLNHLGIDLGDTAAFNVSAEFWPEIKHMLKHVF